MTTETAGLKSFSDDFFILLSDSRTAEESSCVGESAFPLTIGINIQLHVHAESQGAVNKRLRRMAVRMNMKPKPGSRKNIQNQVKRLWHVGERVIFHKHVFGIT